MSVMNAFMAGGELMKDLSPFIKIGHDRGADYYARYSITRYPGAGRDYTHIFSGYVHFIDQIYSDAIVTITIPESYKINSDTNLTFGLKEDISTSYYSSATFNIINNNTAIQGRLYNFQGFIFPSFLCYK